MRRRFRYDPDTDAMVEITDDMTLAAAPAVFGDYEGYTSPIDGKWVEGRRARDEDMKRHGCRPYDPSERVEYKAKIAAEERKLEQSVSREVDRWFATTPSRKHELLEQEIRRGAHGQFVRSERR